MTLSDPSRLGVCSWSLRPASTADLVEKAKRTGLAAVQLALEPLRTAPDRWAEVGAELEAAGIEVVSGMFQAAGEDYTTPQTIRETGGIVPDRRWEENWRRAVEVAGLAAKLGLGLVSVHAGFIPEDRGAGAYGRLVERVRRIADCFGETFSGALLLETGQETAATLEAFLEAVDRPNVGVNFDPANLLLYDMGDPIAALERLLPRVRQVHLKDARRPALAGEWGLEVVVGTGEVDWPAFLRTLAGSGFDGRLIVERETGEDRVGDVRAAVASVTRVMEGLHA